MVMSHQVLIMIHVALDLTVVKTRIWKYTVDVDTLAGCSAALNQRPTCTCSEAVVALSTVAVQDAALASSPRLYSTVMLLPLACRVGVEHHGCQGVGHRGCGSTVGVEAPWVGNHHGYGRTMGVGQHTKHVMIFGHIWPLQQSWWHLMPRPQRW